MSLTCGRDGTTLAARCSFTDLGQPRLERGRVVPQVSSDPDARGSVADRPPLVERRFRNLQEMSDLIGRQPLHQLGTQGLVDTLHAATADNRCGAITISWAQCGEPKSFFRMLNDSYARGAAQGQSIFVATGDDGSPADGQFGQRECFGCGCGRCQRAGDLCGRPQ